MVEEKKEVLFEPFPKQIEFLNTAFSGKFDMVLFGGAIRGGKTFAGIAALLLLCKAYPGSRWAIVRQTLPTLKRNTIPSFNKITPRRFIKSYNQDTQVVTLTNNSQILFFSENFDDDKDLNRFKGLEVNGFLLEEVNELQETTFYKCIERAGTWLIKGGKTPKPLILATCNPANNWVKTLFYDRWKDNTLPERWAYIPSRIFDNPYIPEDYKESLKQMPRYEYEQFVEGNWEIQRKTGVEFYKCFDINRHVKEATYNPDLPIHLSIDENFTPYFPASIWQIEGKKATMIDEITMINPNNTVDGLCKEFERRYYNHSSGLFIYGDATSKKGDVKVEKGYNLYRLIETGLMKYRPMLRVPSSNPSVVIRGQFMNQVFYSGFGGIELSISPTCKIAIADFVNGKEDSDGKKLKEKENGSQKYHHLTDTADYLVCEAFRNEYITYQRGGTKSNPMIPTTPMMGSNRY